MRASQPKFLVGEVERFFFVSITSNELRIIARIAPMNNPKTIPAIIIGLLSGIMRGEARLG
jgi:hypothetical protein